MEGFLDTGSELFSTTAYTETYPNPTGKKRKAAVADPGWDDPSKYAPEIQSFEDQIKEGDRVEGWHPGSQEWIKVTVTQVFRKSFHGQDKNFDKWTGLTQWRLPNSDSTKELAASPSQLENSESAPPTLSNWESSSEASCDDTSPKLNSGTISAPSSQQVGDGTSSQVEVPAKTSASLETEAASAAIAQACSLRCCELLKSPAQLLWFGRTWKALLIQDLDQSLPDSEFAVIRGTLRKLYRQRNLVRLIYEKGSSLLPTPVSYSKGSSERKAGQTKLDRKLRLLPTPVGRDGKGKTQSKNGAGLVDRLRLLPTPVEQDKKGRHGEGTLPNVVEPHLKSDQVLNPRVPRWMMGFPDGWLNTATLDGGETTPLLVSVESPEEAIPEDTSSLKPSETRLHHNKQRSPSKESSTSTASLLSEFGFIPSVDSAEEERQQCDRVATYKDWEIYFCIPNGGIIACVICRGDEAYQFPVGDTDEDYEFHFDYLDDGGVLAHTKKAIDALGQAATEVKYGKVGISFKRTSDRLTNGIKICTRRKWKDSHAAKFIKAYKEGRKVPALDKDKHYGGKQTGWLTLTDCPYKTPDLTDVDQAEVIAEGYPELTPEGFIDKFFEGDINQSVWVVRFTFEAMEVDSELRSESESDSRNSEGDPEVFGAEADELPGVAGAHARGLIDSFSGRANHGGAGIAQLEYAGIQLGEASGEQNHGGEEGSATSRGGTGNTENPDAGSDELQHYSPSLPIAAGTLSEGAGDSDEGEANLPQSADERVHVSSEEVSSARESVDSTGNCELLLSGIEQASTSLGRDINSPLVGTPEPGGAINQDGEAESPLGVEETHAVPDSKGTGEDRSGQTLPPDYTWTHEGGSFTGAGYRGRDEIIVVVKQGEETITTLYTNTLDPRQAEKDWKTCVKLFIEVRGKSDFPDPVFSTLPLTQIRLDGGTQPRKGIKERLVTKYTDLKRSRKLPPVTVFFDKQDYWLADGFHRLEADRRLGRTEIEVGIIEGSVEDAYRYACKANTAHGEPLDAGEVDDAILTYLRHPEWSAWSNYRIAAECGCSEYKIRSMRKKHCDEIVVSQERQYRTPTGAITTMNTANIGKPKGLIEKLEAKPESQPLFPDVKVDRPQNPLEVDDRPFASPHLLTPEWQPKPGETVRIQLRPGQSEYRQLDDRLAVVVGVKEFSVSLISGGEQATLFRDEVIQFIEPPQPEEDASVPEPEVEEEDTEIYGGREERVPAASTLPLVPHLASFGLRGQTQVIDPCNSGIRDIYPDCITNDVSGTDPGADCHLDPTDPEAWEHWNAEGLDWVVSIPNPFEAQAEVVFKQATLFAQQGVAIAIAYEGLASASWLASYSNHIVSILFESEAAWVVWKRDWCWSDFGVSCPFSFMGGKWWNI